MINFCCLLNKMELLDRPNRFSDLTHFRGVPRSLMTGQGFFGSLSRFILPIMRMLAPSALNIVKNIAKNKVQDLIHELNHPQEGEGINKVKRKRKITQDIFNNGFSKRRITTIRRNYKTKRY